MNKKLILGVVLGVVLVYFSFRGVNISETLEHLKKIHPGYVVLSFVMMLIMQTLRSYRWGVILSPMQKIDQLTLFSVTAVGFMAIVAIPARIGELARPYLISRKSHIKMSAAFGTVIVERVLDMLAVLAITLAIVVLQDLPDWMIKSGILFFIMTLLTIAFVIMLVWQRPLAVKIIEWFVRLLPEKIAERINAMVHHFIDGFQVITNVRTLLYLLFLSAAVWLVDVGAIYVLLLAFGFNLPMVASFVVMVVLVAGIAIPTAPGFIGNWHFACILALSLFNIAKPEALSFALVYHLVALFEVVLLGVIFLPFNKFSISDMTRQAEKKEG